MDVAININGILNTLTAGILLLVVRSAWKLSGTVSKIQADQEAHAVLDETRFGAVNQRIDDLRGEVRSELRSAH